MRPYRTLSSLGPERLVTDVEARPTLRLLLIVVPVLAVVLALAAALAIQLWWPGYRLVDAPLHSSLEAVGGVTAVAMAVFLLARRWEEDSDSYFVLALGFLGMGLLDVIHSITTPGHGFVLLHSAASLVGGAWFAATWLPRRAVSAVARARRWAPVAVLVGSVVFAVWTLLARWTLPAMVSQGRFTVTAVVVNVLAGTLFVAAGARLLLSFRKSGLWETYLFAAVSLSLGMAGLLFPYSPVWGGGWWLWHLVRLIAFLVVMASLLRGYGRSVSDLRAHIAERTLAEEALQRSEERYRTMIEHSNDLVWTLDREGGFTYINRVAEQVSGHKAADWLGKSFAPLIVPADLPRVAEVFEKTLSGEPQHYEVTVLHKDGSTLLLSVNTAPVFESGEVVGTVSFGRDITERRLAEDALRETTDYLEKLLDHANAPIIVWDTAFRITRFNNAFQGLTGYSADEVLGQELAMLFPEASRAESLAKIKATLAGEFWESVEIPILKKDGGIRIALWNSANVHGEDGRLMATIAQGVDITERRQAEDEFLSMNKTISALYTIQAAVTQSLDLRKRLHAAIGAACEALGLEAAAIYLLEPDGETLAMRAHKGLSRAFANSTRRIQRGEGVSGKALQLGRPVVLQLDDYPSERLAPIVAKEGLRTFASTPLMSAGETLGALTLGTQRARVFSAEDLELLATIGKLLGTAVHNARLHEAVTQELAERRRAEEALRETTDYLQKLLDYANAPIIVWDTDSRITRFNNAFQGLTGYSADEVVGQELAMLFPEASRAESLEKIKATLAGEFWESVEIPILKKDGGIRIALWNSANVHGEDGRLMATIAQGADITVRKLAEEGLRESVDALAKSNAELERFAFVASHDLQEPLRTVASYVQLLGKRYGDRLDEDAKDFIGYAVDGAKRMQTLINDLLAYSRVATRGEPLAPVDMELVLEQVLSNLVVATEESGAVVTHDPLPKVMGDESQLAQLLQNLIENGIKFRGDGPPKVHVGVESEDGKLVFSVSDNGIGIDPEYFDRIFVVFQRLHSRGDYPGTGIGLAVAKRIVERHGGRMWVRSDKKKGAVFFFTLVPALVTKEGIVEQA